MITRESRRRRIDVLNDARMGMSQKDIAANLGVHASRAHKLYKDASQHEKSSLLGAGRDFDTPESVLYETEMFDGAEIEFDLREQTVCVGGVELADRWSHRF